MSEARETNATAAPGAGHGEAGAGDVHHEPLPVSVYVGVAAALIVMTGVTVGVAQFHFGEWNVVVAMLVASIKASLVVLYFMNLKYDHDRLNRVVFFAAILFLVLYATLTLADQFTRGAVDAVRGEAAPVTARFAAPAATHGGEAAPGTSAGGDAPPGAAAPAQPATPGGTPAPPLGPSGTQPGHQAQPAPAGEAPAAK